MLLQCVEQVILPSSMLTAMLVMPTILSLKAQGKRRVPCLHRQWQSLSTSEKEGASEGAVEGWWLIGHGSRNDHSVATAAAAIEKAE